MWRGLAPVFARDSVKNAASLTHTEWSNECTVRMGYEWGGVMLCRALQLRHWAAEGTPKKALRTKGGKRVRAGAGAHYKNR